MRNACDQISFMNIDELAIASLFCILSSKTTIVHLEMRYAYNLCETAPKNHT